MAAERTRETQKNFRVTEDEARDIEALTSEMGLNVYILSVIERERRSQLLAAASGGRIPSHVWTFLRTVAESQCEIDADGDAFAWGEKYDPGPEALMWIAKADHLAQTYKARPDEAAVRYAFKLLSECPPKVRSALPELFTRVDIESKAMEIDASTAKAAKSKEPEGWRAEMLEINRAFSAGEIDADEMTRRMQENNKKIPKPKQTKRGE